MMFGLGGLFGGGNDTQAAMQNQQALNTSYAQMTLQQIQNAQGLANQQYAAQFRTGTGNNDINPLYNPPQKYPEGWLMQYGHELEAARYRRFCRDD